MPVWDAPCCAEASARRGALKNLLSAPVGNTTDPNASTVEVPIARSHPTARHSPLAAADRIDGAHGEPRVRELRHVERRERGKRQLEWRHSEPRRRLHDRVGSQRPRRGHGLAHHRLGHGRGRRDAHRRCGRDAHAGRPARGARWRRLRAARGAARVVPDPGGAGLERRRSQPDPPLRSAGDPERLAGVPRRGSAGRPVERPHRRDRSGARGRSAPDLAPALRVVRHHAARRLSCHDRPRPRRLRHRPGRSLSRHARQPDAHADRGGAAHLRGPARTARHARRRRARLRLGGGDERRPRLLLPLLHRGSRERSRRDALLGPRGQDPAQRGRRRGGRPALCRGRRDGLHAPERARAHHPGRPARRLRRAREAGGRGRLRRGKPRQPRALRVGREPARLVGALRADGGAGRGSRGSATPRRRTSARRCGATATCASSSRRARRLHRTRAGSRTSRSPSPRRAPGSPTTRRSSTSTRSTVRCHPTTASLRAACSTWRASASHGSTSTTTATQRSAAAGTASISTP